MVYEREKTIIGEERDNDSNGGGQSVRERERVFGGIEHNLDFLTFKGNLVH